jgi:hypothetical protein
MATMPWNEQDRLNLLSAIGKPAMAPMQQVGPAASMGGFIPPYPAGSQGQITPATARQPMPAAAAPAAKKGMWDSFLGGALADPDKRARIAMALEGMTLNPNQALIDNLKSGVERRAGTASRNKTVEWLRSQGREDLANAVESGSITGSDAANILFTAPKDDRTALQKNYEYARSQGMSDAEARTWATSAPVTNIQMGDKAGTAFEVEAAKGQATMFNEMIKQGVDANADLGQIDVIDQLLGQVNGGTADAWRSWAQQSLNVDLGTGGSVEALNAAVNRLVPAQRTPGSGTMSDRDVALFKSSLPQLINSPEGNKIITETMRAMALYKRAQGQIAGEVMAQTKTRAQAIKELQALPDPFEKVKQIVGQTGGGQSTGNMPSRSDAANLLLGNGG